MKTNNNNWFYNSKAWRQTRSIMLNKQPYCQHCIKDNVITTNQLEVHHITPINSSEYKANHINKTINQDWIDIEKLIVLCRQCHAIEDNKHNQSIRKKRKEETIFNKKYNF